MISVAMTTYNGERYIKDQLDSILNQSLAVDEIIICDDGSRDETVKIIKEYEDKYPEVIHLYENESNLGYRLNFKKAMSLCSGDYIFLCDQDDVWKHKKVEQMLAKMQEMPQIQVLATSFTYIDQKGERKPVMPERGKSNNNLYLKEVPKGACVKVTFEEYYNHNFFQGCALLLRRDLKNQVVKHFSTQVAHDYLINFTAAMQDAMYFWNVSLFYYRLHEKNTIGVQKTNMNFLEKMRTRNKLETRTILAVDGRQMLLALRESNPEFYNRKRKYYDEKIKFYGKHIEYLEGRKLIKLLGQMRSPYYGEIKKLKNKGMDLLYVLMG